jgi:hypothetical protein
VFAGQQWWLRSGRCFRYRLCELRPLIIYGYGSTPPKADCPVIHIRVIDFKDYYIVCEDDGVTFNQTLFPTDYITDYTGDECLDMVIVHYPIQGEYSVVVVDVPGGADDPTHTIGVPLDGSTRYITDQGQLVGGESASYSCTLRNIPRATQRSIFWI